jgi:transposase
MNERRDWRLCQQLYTHLLRRCANMVCGRKFKFKHPVKILDSTLISLCHSMYPWAKYRQQKGAMKLHMLLDAKSQIPDVVIMTDGRKHDGKAAKNKAFSLSPDSILVADKAYIDFEWLCQLNQQGVFFVIRTKDNTQVEDLGQHRAIDEANVLADRVVLFRNTASFKKYSNRLRLVSWHDSESHRDFTYITNHFGLPAATIALIYKSRWDIETFFRWIKQNLRIKTFLGTSENAVLTQVWTAMIYYLLLQYIKHQTRYSFSLLHLTRVIREALFRMADIIDLLSLSPRELDSPQSPHGQRLLFDST